MAMYSNEPQAFVLSSSRDDILEVCEILAKEENLKVTVKETAKGAVLTGFGALLGGLLAGPIGLAIGGSAASITAAATCKDFKPVAVIIQEMSPEQKKKLSAAVKKVITNIQPETYFSLFALIMQSATLKEAVIQEIGSFLFREMSYKLIR